MHQHSKKWVQIPLGMARRKIGSINFCSATFFPQEASPSFMRFWVCKLGQAWDLIESKPLNHNGSKEEYVWSAVDCISTS